MFPGAGRSREMDGSCEQVEAPAPPGEGRSAEAWSSLIRAHQQRVVLSLVAAGFSYDRAGELANETWARLMEKDRQGGLREIKLPGLAIVQARYLAWDER